MCDFLDIEIIIQVGVFAKQRVKRLPEQKTGKDKGRDRGKPPDRPHPVPPFFV